MHQWLQTTEKCYWCGCLKSAILRGFSYFYAPNFYSAVWDEFFEKRKHKMFARFDRMAKGFSRIGKDIAIAVKQGGPNPDNNPRLRLAIQNAKGDKHAPRIGFDAAIKRASSKEEKDFQEVIYEGYAPHGVPVVVECATDNPTRTVANIRLLFSKNGGAMGQLRFRYVFI
jgi:transcriptional/translational regulatory protein YebC/TACO1